MAVETRAYKYLIYFVVAFISCYLTQQILLNRLVSIGGGGYVTGGAVIYFLSPLIMDVVAEVYGYKVARKVLWCGLFALLFMGLTVGLVLTLPAPGFWAATTAGYNIALHSVVRTAIVSVFCVSVGQFVNAYLISKWKILVRGRYFWLRSLGSSAIGDSITITLGILTTFFGRIPAHLLPETIIPQVIIMLIFTALGALPAMFLAKIVAKAEGLDNYDVGVNFNPFKIQDNSEKNRSN
jgi:uncharacterized integral membrane protein (TIGR00697 family)